MSIVWVHVRRVTGVIGLVVGLRRIGRTSTAFGRVDTAPVVNRGSGASPQHRTVPRQTDLARSVGHSSYDA